MDGFNTQAILEKIRQDTKDAAAKLLHEAEQRAMTIHEESDLTIGRWLDETHERAARDAEQLAERMGRLALLEEKKKLLEGKRRLIDQAFDLALQKMHSLPREETLLNILRLVVENAKGDETVTAGQVARDFYGPDFLQQANSALVGAGKPGQLTDSGKTGGDFCGVVLESAQSQIHCSYESLLDSRKDELEAQVATILFPVDPA